ncbi:MAG: hydantoinase B/oxoprolinase family protein [Nitrospirota bacterium]
MHDDRSPWRFAIDRGGTFTDIIGVDSAGRFHTLKLLSNAPGYDDASLEGIRRILRVPSGIPLPEERIASIRFGTTVATNALLEGKGGRVALFITEGFADLLEIGHQARPDIFSLCIKKPLPLYAAVFEMEERISSSGDILKPLNEEKLSADIEQLKTMAIDAVAVVSMHSWKNPEHELLCETVLRAQGIEHIFLSHRCMNTIKIVGRGQSTIIDAYLSAPLARYLETIRKHTGSIPVGFMQSSGRLAATDDFTGKSALLSGPAGGVIAVADICRKTGVKGAIGFDMGGTSTDVTRFDGTFDRAYEQAIGGIEFQTETLNITTVASGGGSLLWFDGERMRVGPESAGALPGPACYGFGGPLTITDANLLTGRIIPEYFPKTFGPARNAPLDAADAALKLRSLTDTINHATGTTMSLEETASGFLRIANETMAMAIKEISIARGFEVSDYALVCFGGAGGQHACAVAAILGMKNIIVHPLCGLMSAYGIGLAQQAVRSTRTVLRPYHAAVHDELHACYREMESALLTGTQGMLASPSVKREIDLRLLGSDSFLTVEYTTFEETVGAFRTAYFTIFGFFPEEAGLEAVNIRVEVRDERGLFPEYREPSSRTRRSLSPASWHRLYYRGRYHEAPVHHWHALPLNVPIDGPAIIVDPYATIIVEPGFEAAVSERGTLHIKTTALTAPEARPNRGRPDPVLLEVFNNLFRGIATEMGYVLRNTAHSVNIKERLDFSCAVFDAEGNLVANAPHIPVHLGSMADTVKAVIEDHGPAMRPGDLYLSNNPYRGGSHLPDITLVCPVFADSGEILFFTAARGHHADIGGITPGSLPSVVTHIDEEGVLIDSIKVAAGGKFFEHEIREVLLRHRYPVRTITERLLDLKAQIAACRNGMRELRRIMEKYGRETVVRYMGLIRENAARSVQQSLLRFLGSDTIFTSSFEDFLDDGTPIRVRISVRADTASPETVRAVIDFTGTGAQHSDDNLNAPLSVTRSAVLYVLRSIASCDIPLNSGCLKPITLIVPEGSLLNPAYPVPVASGNVETSQRIVDVLLGAFGIAAASQGTMNNLLFEVEGDTPYYETIAGGAGAMQDCPGASGVQVHMTNTRITDPEVLEFRHPGVLLNRFSIRKGSGGEGRFRGGDGVVREITFLKPASVSIISERRVHAPYGMEGGDPGKRGANFLKTADGSLKELPHRISLTLKNNDSLIIETPGGGGFGRR